MHKYRESLADAQDFKAGIATGTTKVLVQLPLHNRIAAAVPDLAMAVLFLWCWLAPTAWRPTLASELGQLMLMEFFVMHSGMFLGGTASVQQEGIGTRLVTAMIVTAFYVPVAGAFAYVHGGWTPFLGFGWLLMMRVLSMLAAQGAGEFESKRQRFYWANGGAFYILAVMAALLLPLPQLGFRGADGVFWDKWWSVSPKEMIAWGFLYFAALAVTKLLEKPEWIYGADDPA